MKTVSAVLIVLSLFSLVSAAEPGLTLTKTGDSVVDPEALSLGDPKYGPMKFSQRINGCSFQQDAVVSHNGFQYVGYYNGDRRVCIARRALPDGRWEVICFKDYRFKNNDAHNTISLGICPKDGTIHIAFDHHVHPLHYRVSQKGAATKPRAHKWNTALFGPILSELEPGKPIRVTYPRFFQTPAGGLQFCYRRGGSGNGDRMLVDYDPATGRWNGTRQIDSSKGRYQDSMGKSNSRCSYPNGYTYGPKGNLHATWVWRESSQGANHDLVYIFSSDGGKTWRNNKGALLKGPATVNAPDSTVVTIDRKYGLMNTHGQDVDSKGRVHVILRHCSDASFKAAGEKPGQNRFGTSKSNRYFHYWRADDGTWSRNELPGKAGSRPKIFMDAKDNSYVICNIDKALVILAAKASSKWREWNVIHREKGPFINEMLGDPCRWNKSGVLSVMVQEQPREKSNPSPLRILDFK